MLQIDFLPEGNAEHFLREGWSFQESIGIWALGTESSLSLPPAATSEAHLMSIRLFQPIGPPKVFRQRLELILNGRVVHRDEIEPGERKISCVIPEGLLSTHVDNNLVISHPDAAASRDASQKSLDPRQLAVCFVSLELKHLLAHDTKVANERAADSVASVPHNDEVRALVLCLGNAVSREVVQILQCFPLFDAAFELRVAKDVPSGAAILNSLSNNDRKRLAGVWEQVSVADETRELQRFVPASAIYVRFPHLSLNCLWPLQGHDPRLIPEHLYPGGRYPYTDVAGVQLHGESLNLSDEELYEAYLELSARLLPDLEEKWKLDELRWQALDAHCDVKVAKFIRAKFKRERLFYSPEMPCATLLTYIAEHLMGSLLPTMQLQPSGLYREFSTYVHGYQDMFNDQTPIHPSVLKAFNVPGVSLDFEYRREYSKRTFREHIVDYIRWTPWFAGGRAREIGLV
jgi:hypothetical protein